MLDTVFLYLATSNEFPSPLGFVPVTWFSICPWCFRSFDWILAYETIEATKQIRIATEACLKAMSLFHTQSGADKIELAQKLTITRRTRFDDTTCLYLIPKCRANSLSTLTAVEVMTDTPHKTALSTPPTLKNVTVFPLDITIVA